MHPHTAVPGASSFPAPAGKTFLPLAAVAACKTFREAVRLAWEHRTRPNMTQRSLAEECGLYPPHVSSYLHPDALDAKRRPRLDLPADRIDAFEAAVGNHAIRQYLNHLGRLTIMEEVIAQRAA